MIVIKIGGDCMKLLSAILIFISGVIVSKKLIEDFDIKSYLIGFLAGVLIPMVITMMM